jgi:hypothetical protein
MTQDIERLEHLTASTPEEQINPIVRSKKDRRRRQARELKEKAEDEQRKDGKRKTGDRLMLSDPELLGEDGDEHAQDDGTGENDTPTDDDDEELNKETSDGHIDLKA